MKQRYIFSAILIGLFIMLSVNMSYAQFAGGDGSKENPFLVADAYHLDNVRNYLEAHFLQINDIDLYDYASGNGWSPINGFQGVYSGKGYYIKNLSINRPNYENIGLFGSIENANIGGIRLIDFSVVGYNNVGSLAGYALQSNVSFISAEGIVNGQNNIGGIIGYLDKGYMKNSYSSTNSTGNSSTGCLIGILDNSTIINCYAEGDVVGESIVGGLVGFFNESSTISNSYAAGSVQGVFNTGGLIGYGYGEVLHSYWDIEKTGRSSSAGGEGRSTVDMTYPYDINTYVDWDFLYRWGADSDYTINGYPFLRSVKQRVSNNDFGGGTGQVNDPWKIETPEHLNNVRNYLGYDHYFRYYSQENDIDLSDFSSNQGWSPIGSIFMPFMGNYDGNLYSISNLYIYRPNGYYIGLFGYVSHILDLGRGVLANISLENVEITGQNYTASLAGWIGNTLVMDCSVSGYISGDSYVGGLLGMVRFYSEIKNCSGNIDVVASSYVGGLIGFSRLYPIISKSYSKGSVIGDVYVGGLVGFNACVSYIENSFSTSTVYGNEIVGGLVGENIHLSVISKSYATGNVTSNGELGVPGGTGGLVGRNYTDGLISNCYSTGFVMNIGPPNCYTGGLIGNNLGTVVNSYWDVESSGQTNSEGGTGLTTLEMLQSNNFTGWDFEETWKILDFSGFPYIRKHYPILQWQLGSSLAHNRIDNAHVHRYKERKWHWRSFPRLEVQDSHDDTIDLLYPLAGIIDMVESMSGHMIWWQGAWQIFGAEVAFKSVEGYKLRFTDLHEHFLYVSGPRESRNTEITLYPNQENWIGYFLPNTQSVFAAFGSEVMDQLQSIKTDEWGMYRVDEDTWIGYVSQPYYTIRQVTYGKMYVVETRVDDPVTFRWLGDDIPEPPEPPIPPVKFFLYDEKPDYESFFIEDIEDDDDVLEVAVLAGDECVGASVFLGGYPLEILAYTDESHYGEEISFVILRDDKNRVPEKIRVP